jgi:hypothetical protein
MHVDKTFARHKPGEEGVERIRELRAAYSTLKAVIERVVPHTRERSVALTELETSAMWATKAAIFTDPDAVIEP